MSPGQATSMTPPSFRVLPQTLAPSITPAHAPTLAPVSPDGSEDGRGLCVDSRRGSSTWPQWCWRHERRPHAAEKVKAKEEGKGAREGWSPSNSKRQGEGRRKYYYLFLQSSSARPCRPHQARRSKHGQQTLYWALCRLLTLTCLPPRVVWP